MSKRRDYDRLASEYDSAMSAVGSDVISAMMQFHGKKPIKDLRVLDAGCGTGNDAKDLNEYGVGHVTLLDASKCMLDEARIKLSKAIAEGSVAILESTIPPLPFQDASFDAVTFNRVLNHLDKEGDSEYPNCIESLKEATRVSSPDGVIVISAVLPSAFTDSIWFTQLNKGLTERFIKILPSVNDYEKMFEAAGVKCIQKMNILGSEVFRNYFYLEGPLDENWRKGYLYWESATGSELAEVKHKIEELKHKGGLEKWVKEHDHTNTAGLLTIFVCKSTK